MTEFQEQMVENILKEIALMDLGEISLSKLQSNWAQFQDIQRLIVEHFSLLITHESHGIEHLLADEELSFHKGP